MRRRFQSVHGVVAGLTVAVAAWLLASDLLSLFLALGLVIAVLLVMFTVTTAASRSARENTREGRRVLAAVVGLPAAVVAGYGVGWALHGLGAPLVLVLAAAAIPLVGYGWVVDRWWAAFPLPLIVGAIYLIVLRVVDAKTGGCSVCGEDEDWSNYPFFFAFTAVLPVTVVAAIGLGLRGMRDLYREHQTERANGHLAAPD